MGHYISPNHIHTCTHITPTTAPTVLAANGHKMKPTHSVTVPLTPARSNQVQQGHVLRLQHLSTGSLIFIGNLCDNDCTAIFSKDLITVTKNNTPIMERAIKQMGSGIFPSLTTPAYPAHIKHLTQQKQQYHVYPATYTQTYQHANT